MEKWEKSLRVVGIVWLVLTLLFVVDYCHIIRATVDCAGGAVCPDMSCSAVNYIVGFLVVGIPSWILFFVVYFRGRKK